MQANLAATHRSAKSVISSVLRSGIDATALHGKIAIAWEVGAGFTNRQQGRIESNGHVKQEIVFVLILCLLTSVGGIQCGIPHQAG